MQEKLGPSGKEQAVNFSVEPGGAVVFQFTAPSAAKKPVLYMFRGKVETYQFDREESDRWPTFDYVKVDGEGGWRWASHAARDRFAHVCRFITEYVKPAAKRFAKTNEYDAELIESRRLRLVQSLGKAHREYESAVRRLEECRDNVAGAEAALASFDERHGAKGETV